MAGTETPIQINCMYIYILHINVYYWPLLVATWTSRKSLKLSPILIHQESLLPTIRLGFLELGQHSRRALRALAVQIQGIILVFNTINVAGVLSNDRM